MRWFVPMVSLAGLHVVLAIGCVIALYAVDAPLLGGVHPALKPLKFAVSVAILLFSIALVLRQLDVGDGLRWTFAATISLTMIVEMVAVVAQALRGRSSHYNVSTPLDAALWNVMAIAIVTATLALVALAIVATVRPLRMEPLVALGVRVGLWTLLAVAVSGFSMAGRRQHTVGGADGGAGLPVTQWSSTHGDLRVSHFFALHGLQVLPLVAMVLLWLPIYDRARWIGFVLCSLAWCAVTCITLAQAMAGRPFLR